MKYRSGIIGPLILIVAGILLLLNNLAMLPGGFWWTLWKFWPAIFILAGIDIIANHVRSGFLAYALYITEAVIIAILITAAWMNAGTAPSFLPAFIPSIITGGPDMGVAGNYIFQDLSHANFSGANLAGSNFIMVDISHTNFSGADIRGANIVMADMSYADLSHARIDGANFVMSDMSNVDLEGTEPDRANLVFVNRS